MWKERRAVSRRRASAFVQYIVSHRTFIDRNGTSWEVWDVIPGWANRRARYDRRSASRESDRRGAEGRWLGVRPDLADGWLCFRAGGEKRRLAPIPDGWESLTDERLAELVTDATAAPTQSRRV
jgi:hypothetical protein